MSTVNFHVEWVKIGIERKREQDEWIATLRAHPELTAINIDCEEKAVR